MLTAAALWTTACTAGGNSRKASAPTGKPVETKTATTTATPGTAKAAPAGAAQNGSLTSNDVAPLPLEGAGCEIGERALNPLGEITFVKSGRVIATDSLGGSPRCLLKLQSDVVNLAWSPAGTRLLLDGDAVADAAGVRVSGFLPTNRDVQWSGPNGTSLLASTATGKLVKRSSSTAARTDVSFLDRHDSSAYHPAGKAIVSLGSGFDTNTGKQTVGVWLADNRGQGSRLLVRDESAATIGEPRFDVSGTKLYFLAAHAAGQSHVHVYDTEAGTLEVAYDGRGPFAGLVTSGVDETTWAVRVGDCSGKPTTVASFGAEPLPVDQPELRGQAVEPVGWLANHVLLVMARPQGCTGPGALWRLSDEGLAVKIADGVSAAAPRLVRGIAKELSIPIGRQVLA